ncbi:flavin-dependent oxidoreductase [Rothia terrae]|uniref:FAD-dependent monooxygenase n=1 Tax=Rothia terrae TaxID=396015 RepID=UPI001444A267|nr:FAD-dependent monooxygenase [Rothia terrae]NKZ34421.1 flavin-dependent oxidoreductase [Rothia terrae]
MTTSETTLAHRHFSENEQQFSVHRGKLQMMLFDAVQQRLPQDSVLTGQQVESLTEDAERVLVEVTDRHHDDRTVTYAAKVLIGADGVHSKVRKNFHPDANTNNWEGTTMFRGTYRAQKPFLTGRSMVLVYGEDAKRFLTYPISREAEQEGQSLINWVAMVPQSKGKTVSERETQNVPTDPSDVLPYFDDWGFDWLDIKTMISGAEDVLSYPMVDREPLASWGQGRVTLLGDTAHPMYPIGANGGSQAIRDAVTLATYMGDTAVDGDLVQALCNYETERIPATTTVVEANRKLNQTERKLANLSQEKLEEMAHNGRMDEIQEAYAHGDFDKI